MSSRIVQIAVDSYLDSSLKKLEEELRKTGEEIVSTNTAGSLVLVTVRKVSGEVIKEVPENGNKLLLG